MRSDKPWRTALAFGLAVSANGCSLVISTDDLQPAGNDGAIDSGTADVFVPVDSAKDSSGATDSGSPSDTAKIDSSPGDTKADATLDTIAPPDTTIDTTIDTLPDTSPFDDTGPACSGSHCGGACVDTANDPANCGGCGKRCRDYEQCAASKCECRTNLTSCSGLCADLKGEQLACGSCFGSCSGGKTCIDGSCGTGGCPAGRTPCTGASLGANGCFDLNDDARHCGACAVTCRFDEVCAAGTCRSYAPAISGCASCASTLGVPSATCCTSSTSVDFCVDGSVCPGWL